MAENFKFFWHANNYYINNNDLINIINNSESAILKDGSFELKKDEYYLEYIENNGNNKLHWELPFNISDIINNDKVNKGYTITFKIKPNTRPANVIGNVHKSLGFNIYIWSISSSKIKIYWHWNDDNRIEIERDYVKNVIYTFTYDKNNNKLYIYENTNEIKVYTFVNNHANSISTIYMNNENDNKFYIGKDYKTYTHGRCMSNKLYSISISDIYTNPNDINELVDIHTQLLTNPTKLIHYSPNNSLNIPINPLIELFFDSDILSTNIENSINIKKVNDQSNIVKSFRTNNTDDVIIDGSHVKLLNIILDNSTNYIIDISKNAFSKNVHGKNLGLYSDYSFYFTTINKENILNIFETHIPEYIENKENYISNLTSILNNNDRDGKREEYKEFLEYNNINKYLFIGNINNITLSFNNLILAILNDCLQPQIYSLQPEIHYKNNNNQNINSKYIELNNYNNYNGVTRIITPELSTDGTMDISSNIRIFIPSNNKNNYIKWGRYNTKYRIRTLSRDDNNENNFKLKISDENGSNEIIIFGSGSNEPSKEYGETFKFIDDELIWNITVGCLEEYSINIVNIFDNFEDKINNDYSPNNFYISNKYNNDDGILEDIGFQKNNLQKSPHGISEKLEYLNNNISNNGIIIKTIDFKRTNDENPYLQQVNNSIFNNSDTSGTFIFLAKWSGGSNSTYSTIYSHNYHYGYRSLGISKGMSLTYKNKLFTSTYYYEFKYSDSINDNEHKEKYAIYSYSFDKWNDRSNSVFRYNKRDLSNNGTINSNNVNLANNIKGRLGSWHDIYDDFTFEGNIALALIWDKKLDIGDIENIENLIQDKYFIGESKILYCNIRNNQKNIDINTNINLLFNNDILGTDISNTIVIKKDDKTIVKTYNTTLNNEDVIIHKNSVTLNFDCLDYSSNYIFSIETNAFSNINNKDLINKFLFIFYNC